MSVAQLQAMGEENDQALLGKTKKIDQQPAGGVALFGSRWHKVRFLP